MLARLLHYTNTRPSSIANVGFSCLILFPKNSASVFPRRTLQISFSSPAQYVNFSNASAPCEFSILNWTARILSVVLSARHVVFGSTQGVVLTTLKILSYSGLAGCRILAPSMTNEGH